MDDRHPTLRRDRKKNSDVAPPVELVAATGRRGRILVVDDEELVVRSVKRIRSKEHDVVATVSATEALALCAGGEQFDLILCDLMMPEMTGMDLHRELALVAPEQADRIIFVTGGAFYGKGVAFPFGDAEGAPREAVCFRQPSSDRPAVSALGPRDQDHLARTVRDALDHPIVAPLGVN